MENLITEPGRAARRRFIQNTNVQISPDERPSCWKHELLTSRRKCESRAHFVTRDVAGWGFVLGDSLAFPRGSLGLWPRHPLERGLDLSPSGRPQPSVDQRGPTATQAVLLQKMVQKFSTLGW